MTRSFRAFSWAFIALPLADPGPGEQVAGT